MAPESAGGRHWEAIPSGTHEGGGTGRPVPPSSRSVLDAASALVDRLDGHVAVLVDAGGDADALRRVVGVADRAVQLLVVRVDQDGAAAGIAAGVGADHVGRVGSG